MSPRYIHHIDHCGLRTFTSRSGRMRDIAVFQGTDEGVSAFSNWLANQPKGIHTVLVDQADEGFQIELVPYVTRQDREALIARKLGQIFLGSQYSTAVSLGREKAGRRDEKILFTALTRPASVEPWLRALRRQEVPLSAIYSVPLLTRQLLTVLDGLITAPRGLIITFSSAGIRQTFFDEGELRFSRLAPPPEGEFATWGGACLRETQKTWQYLTGQRWVSRNEPLPAWILLDQMDFAPVLAELDALDSVLFHPINLDTLKRRVNVSMSSEGSDSKTLLSGLALRETRGPQLAPRGDRSIFRLVQARTAITACGMLLGASLGIWGMKFFWEGRELASRTTSLVQHEQELKRQSEALMARLPAMPTSLESLQVVLREHETQTRLRGTPAKALTDLSAVLNLYPEIEIRKIDWQHPDSAGQKEKLSAENTTPRSVAYTMLIDATLPTSGSTDPRQTIARIKAFATSAGTRFPGSEITLPKLPFDAEPNQTLRSETTSGVRAPEFQLRWITAEEQP